MSLVHEPISDKNGIIWSKSRNNIFFKFKTELLLMKLLPNPAIYRCILVKMTDTLSQVVGTFEKLAGNRTAAINQISENRLTRFLPCVCVVVVGERGRQKRQRR